MHLLDAIEGRGGRQWESAPMTGVSAPDGTPPA